MSNLIKTPVSVIRELIKVRQNLYRLKVEKKKDGSDRILHIPSPELKTTQKKINRNISNFLKLPSYIHSQSGHSHVHHAMSHIGRPMVYVFDIEDFFPSITGRMLKKILMKHGMSEIVANSITKLCTYSGFPQGRKKNLLEIFFHKEHRLVQHLPQWLLQE
ncbi:hypothetical protein KKG41_01305 [Patescibacteria group bacterium]|nr:hypothetical protein [Patescibacteria group bacterium]